MRVSHPESAGWSLCLGGCVRILSLGLYCLSQATHPAPEPLPSTCKLAGIIFQLASVIIHFFQKQILKIPWQEHCSLNTVEKRSGSGLEEFSQTIENIKGAVGKAEKEQAESRQVSGSSHPLSACSWTLPCNVNSQPFSVR